jgi:hypothetical protein
VAGTYSVAHVRNSEIKQLRPLFFSMLWYIDLIYGTWVYTDKLQIKFTFRSGPMISGRVMALGLKFGHIFSCRHLFPLCLEILTWCLVYECILINYRLSLRFVPVQWFLAEIWPLDWNLAKYLVVATFFRYAWRYWLDVWLMSV